ncbi:MAG: hypothetical protein ACLRRN_01180 [Oscillospiraceae bacterium]
MHYVVMDLEWNQAMSSKSSVFNKLPIHLRGEIIEIGAVKLNEDMTPAKNFRSMSSPCTSGACTTRSKSSPASTASGWLPA